MPPPEAGPTGVGPAEAGPPDDAGPTGVGPAEAGPPDDAGLTGRSGHGVPTAAPEPGARPATGSACVYVVGMHRSGTSAVTGLLARLGLSVPTGGDRVGETAGNPRGHFESRRLIRLNNQLLVDLGGTWSAPPAPPAGWPELAPMVAARPDAAAAFAATFPRRPAAWKDPRTCLTLPFWRLAVPGPAVAVLVLRHPVEVADSLRSRDGFPRLLGLALWERYTRAAVAGAAAMPVLAADLGRVLADPAGWCDTLVGFLADAGVGVDPAAADVAAGSLEPGLRHRRDRALPTGLPDDAPRHYDALAERLGPHPAWQPPDLGDEPEWVGDVLALRREGDELRRHQAALETSRAYRLARSVGRLRGGGPAR